MPMSSMSRRPTAWSFRRCARSLATWARTATVCWPSSSVRASSLSLPRTSLRRGVSYGGRIALLPGQSKAEEFATLVHEVAHELLHKAERRTTTTKIVKETEAEAVAFVVGKAVGLETGSSSADYIHLYHGNASLLAESLEVVQQTSAVILAALEPCGTKNRFPMQNWRRWRDANRPPHPRQGGRVSPRPVAAD